MQEAGIHQKPMSCVASPSMSFGSTAWAKALTAACRCLIPKGSLTRWACDSACLPQFINNLEGMLNPSIVPRWFYTKWGQKTPWWEDAPNYLVAVAHPCQKIATKDSLRCLGTLFFCNRIWLFFQFFPLLLSCSHMRITFPTSPEKASCLVSLLLCVPLHMTLTCTCSVPHSREGRTFLHVFKETDVQIVSYNRIPGKIPSFKLSQVILTCRIGCMDRQGTKWLELVLCSRRWSQNMIMTLYWIPSAWDSECPILAPRLSPSGHRQHLVRGRSRGACHAACSESQTSLWSWTRAKFFC